MMPDGRIISASDDQYSSFLIIKFHEFLFYLIFSSSTVMLWDYEKGQILTTFGGEDRKDQHDDWIYDITFIKKKDAPYSDDPK